MQKLTGIALAVVVACVVGVHPLGAQNRDSVPKFSLFGGTAGDGVAAGRDFGTSNFEMGGSVDFKLGSLAIPLRATLAFSQQHRDFYLSDRRSGYASIDVVGRPTRSIFGIQPYLLGGLGLATQADYGAVVNFFPQGSTVGSAGIARYPRQNWAFLEGGMGLELGKHLFIQSKLQLPVASQGPTRTPVSIGIRF